MDKKDLENKKDQPSARALQGVRGVGVWGRGHEGVEALVQISDLVTGLVQKIPKRSTKGKIDWIESDCLSFPSALSPRAGSHYVNRKSNYTTIKKENGDSYHDK